MCKDTQVPRVQYAQERRIPDGWIERPLSEICKKPISYGIVQTGESVTDGVPCVRVVDLTKDELTIANMITTSQEISRSYKKTILEKNEIMIALRGEIGLVKLVTDNLIGVNLTRGIARISTKDKVISPHFLLWQIRSRKFSHELLRRVNGSALKEIPLGELRKVPTIIPPYLEQTKIAQILSTWDNAIKVTENLIKNTQAQKKALMQQLLTGKNRLKGENDEWKTFSLGELFKERKEINNIDLSLLSITKENGVIHRDDVGRRDTSNEDKTKYRRICPGDIGYNTMRMWQGVSALSDKEGIVSPAYTIISAKNNVNALFMSYLFKLPRTVHDFYRYSQGLVSDTWNLKFRHFKEVKVLIPNKKEQQNIASVLLNVDREIKLLCEKIDLLHQEKKALMQQLLTGKRRIKVDKSAA